MKTIVVICVVVMFILLVYLFNFYITKSRIRSEK
jgi:preprotein translocase subunit SecE